MRILGSPSRPRTSSLMLLAPSAECVPDVFRQVDVDPQLHEWSLAQVQRMRGSIYLHDGAITTSHLTPDGRHAQDVDAHSWHLLSVQPDGRVVGCARYRPHGDAVRPEDLGAWKSPLAKNEATRPLLRNAIERELSLARRRDCSYVEVGGWAIASDFRHSGEAVTIALATYALAEALGGCIGITTATVRHSSSTILRKLGGRSLEHDGGEIPPYFDPQYGCEMELLRFDSSAPSQRVQPHIGEISGNLGSVMVLCGRTTPSTVAGRFSQPAQPPRVAAAALVCA